MAEEQGNGGGRVSWETYTLGQQEIHREQLDLRRELAARDQQYMDTLTAMRGEVALRDRHHADILAEVRDSLGDMHRALLGLPCDEHKIALAHLAKDVAALQERGILLRKAAEVIQPVMKPKLLVGAMGVVATVLGWEWWQRLQAAIEKVLR